MVDISSQNNKINITVSSRGNTANTNVTPDSTMYYSNKSKEWAISNKIVDNTDYSSKYYANESKKQADISTAKATEVVESGNTALNNIDNAKSEALTDIETLHSSSVTDITNLKNTSISNITTAKDNAATEVVESGNTAVSNIESARDNAIINVNTAGAVQVELATEQATIATNKTSEVVASGNEALSNIDTAKNNAITSITNQETTSKNVLIDEGATQIGLIQNEGATQVANVQSTGFYMRDDKLYFINSQGEEEEFKSGGSGLELCDIGMALYVDETKGLRRYLNGQIVDINTNTQAFLDRLKQITTFYPSLLCTEDEWQTAKTLSAVGQVGRFVFNYNGDEIVSVRLPRVVNVQGLFDLQNLGMTVEAGLPTLTTNSTGAHTHTRGTMNITGSAWNGYRCFLTDANGAIYGTGSSRDWGGQGSVTSFNGFAFDASRNWTGSTSSNGAHTHTIAGTANTVQPEAIQYPYFIQVATGQETTADVKNELQLNNPYSLFDSKFSDHELNNLSWLKSEGQWNSGTVYVDAYNELLAEYNNAESVEETEGTVTFKRTPKGYKITLSTQETAILNKYNTDGIAWYYILDTANTQFKLPRTKFGFEGLRTSVGDDIKAGLPNITGSLDVNADRNIFNWGQQGAFYRDGSGGRKWAAAESATNSKGDIHFDASHSNPIYGNSNTVQPPATQMYLYFYVGETVQNANLIDAGRIGEQLANKVNMLQASGAGMPSSRYIDLTLGASGTAYTAPADGWVQAVCNSSSDSPAFIEVNTEYASSTGTRYKGGWGRATIPVTKGRTFNVYYGGADFEIKMFRFTYAVGSESEAL